MDERAQSRLRNVAPFIVALSLGFGIRALILSKPKAEAPAPVAVVDKADQACCQAEETEPAQAEVESGLPGTGGGTRPIAKDEPPPDQRSNEERALATLAELAGRRVREQNQVDLRDAPPGSGNALIPGPSGQVKGRVTFQGSEPAPRMLEMTMDPRCLQRLDELTKQGAQGKLPARLVFRDGPSKEYHTASWTEGQATTELDLSIRGTVAQRDVLVTKGALADVFVWVEDLPPEPFAADPDGAPVVLDQRACAYEPFVLGVRVGQTLRIVNSDPTLHNVHARAQRGEFNLAMPKQGQHIERVFKTPQVLVPVVCEVHAWMHAFIGVVPHAHWAITGPDGRFDLPNVPVGKHTLALEHPTLGKKTIPIEVSIDGVLELDPSFKAAGQ